MDPARRARRFAWAAIGLLAVAVPLFFIPYSGDSYGDPTWATAGVIVLHPAAFAGLGAMVTYRDLGEDSKEDARVAAIAFPLVVLGAFALWLFWT